MTDMPKLLDRLFPTGHHIAHDGVYFSGTGINDGTKIAVIGTSEVVEIGVEMALAMAGDVLDVVRRTPGRPIVLLVATSGQRLSKRDEILGINSYLAHLAKSIDLAKRHGHKVIALVWSRAVSGGFLATSMLSDLCYALEGAEIGVMNLPAMSRITKIPVERLSELSNRSPVFAPGVENYRRMGAIEEIWSDDLALRLAAALRQESNRERRRIKGIERGGRTMAQMVANTVRANDRA